MTVRRARPIFIALLTGAALLASSCALSPDPWSPKTYRLELSRYTRDTGALSSAWKKYRVKGMETDSFFYADPDRQSVITVAFTCGKYRDIPMPILAEHLIIPMGRKPTVVREGYVRRGRREVYHLVARGPYLYQKEETYKDIGHVDDERADMMVDAYLVREPHCLVDLSLSAAPEYYDQTRPEFETFVRSVGAPLDRGAAGAGEGG